MTEQCNVTAVVRKKAEVSEEYLQFILRDRVVSFFKAPDVAVDVEVGHTVTCEVVQKGQWWNGRQLTNVTTGVAAKVPAPSKAAAPASTPAPAAARPTPPSQGGNIFPEGATGGDKQSLFSQRVAAGNLTYYIDVRVAKNNKKYLTITQTETQGKQRVIVFSDKAKEFAEALKQALDEFTNPN